MKLYHGTFINRYYNMIEEGKIRFTKENEDQTTKDINNVLNACFEKDEMRRKSIFFFNKINYQGGYDCILTIDTNSLDLNKLYVADFKAATMVYIGKKRGLIASELEKLCCSYYDSFISWDEYTKGNRDISIPEFLYIGGIPIKYVEKVRDHELIDDIFD